MEAQTNLSEAGIDAEIEEAVADKGYHATDTLELADWLNIRTYIPERKPKGKRKWTERVGGRAAGVSQQPPPDARRAEQTAATAAKRTGRAELRPHVRQRAVPGGVGCVGSRRCRSVT